VKDDLEVWMSFQKHRTVPSFPGHAGGTARSWPNSRPAGGMCKLLFVRDTFLSFFSERKMNDGSELPKTFAKLDPTVL